MLRHWKLLPACALCVLGMAGLLSGRTLEPDAGVLVTDAPRQAPTAAAPFRILDYELTPRAAYDIEARVLGIERYRDESAPLSPLDLAVGWGPMSDSAVLETFRVHQAARFFTLYPTERSIDMRVALVNAANMHLIPASSMVAGRLRKIRRGQVVRLRGLLVDVSGPRGFRWKTSLTRDDVGAGACELFYVEEVAWR